MPTVTSSGGFKPSTTDTPLDARTRVNTYAEIRNIQNPYVDMEITVLSDETNYNEKTKYEVVSLLPNEQGIENSIIDLSTLRKKIELYSEDEDIVFNGGSDTTNLIQYQPMGVSTPLTTITSEETTISGDMSYIVKNGICYVTIWGATGTTIGNNYVICSTMPKPIMPIAQILNTTIDNSIMGSAYIDGDSTILKLSVFTMDVIGYGSFSYPVATS